MYLTQGLHRSVQQNPDRVATVHGDRVRTFRESADRIARLAGVLRAHGVRDGDRVGVWGLNSDRFTECLLAVPWAGAVLNPVNNRWSPEEISASLVECQTDVLIVDADFAPLVEALEHPGLRHVIPMEYDELLAGTEPFEDRLRGGDDLLGIFYTGGTTGFPKGVMLSHDNILTSVLGTQTTGHWADPHGSTLHVAPLFHLAAAANWASQLTVGGAHVTLPGFDPAQVLGAVEEHRISTALLVPTMIQLVVDHPDATHRNVDSVKTLIYGASPITAALLERAMKVFRHADFVQAYGMTELAPVATILTPEDHREGRLRSAGRAAAHAEVRIVGPDDEPLAVREVGEVVCRGSHVMQGYWNQPEATAEALRGGWMHTGDLGYLDEEGYLFITDRLKDMIITGGENVYSTEVENALGSHPAVAACAVVGVPDEVWGERVHAVVVLRPGAIATGDVLRAHCRARIADYKAPRSWEFTDALPLSNTGKVLKHVIRAAHWGGANRGVN